MISRIRRYKKPELDAPRPAKRLRRTQGKPGRYVIDWGASLGAKLQLFLMTSYLYYACNRSVITDNEFDRLCSDLLNGWLRFRHPHKHCVTREDLRATTGYAIQYPTIVKNAAAYLLGKHGEVDGRG